MEGSEKVFQCMIERDFNLLAFLIVTHGEIICTEICGEAERVEDGVMAIRAGRVASGRHCGRPARRHGESEEREFREIHSIR
jgi:hypothetical protein